MTLERHHLQTKRKDKDAIEKICVQCHKTVHGLFSHKELRDSRLCLDTLEGLLQNERFVNALTFIRKTPSFTFVKMKQARSRRRRR